MENFNCVIEARDCNTNKLDKTSSHLKHFISTVSLEDSFRKEIKHSYSNSPKIPDHKASVLDLNNSDKKG